MTNTKNELLLPLNLQFFAEGDADTPQSDGSQTNPDAQSPANTKVDASDSAPKTLSLTQAELDALIDTRLKRERKKYADYDEVKAKADEYAKELEAKRQAELSEVERAQEVAKKYEEEKQTLAAQLEAVKKKAEQERIRNEFTKLAAKADIEYVDDALALADLSKVSVDEDGNVSGVDEVVSALVESKPFLLKKKTQEIGQTMNVSGTQSGPISAETRLAEAAEKARKSGTLADKVAYAQLKKELRK